MEYNRLKWYTVLVPSIFITLVVTVDRYYLESHFGVRASLLAMIVALVVGTYLFSEYVFAIIERINRAVRRQEERTEALFTNTSDAILFLDRDTRVQAINPAAERLMGWKGQELIGEHLCLDISQCARMQEAGADCYAREVIRTGRPIPYVEMTIASRFGQIVPVSASYSRLPDPETHSGAQAAIILRDLTEKKKLEAEVESLYEETRRRREEAEALYTLGREMSSLVDLEDNIGTVVEKTRLLLASDLAGWVVRGEEEDQIHWKALSGGWRSELRKRRWDVGEGLIGQAISEGKLSRVPEDGDPMEDPVLAPEAIRTALVVPMESRGRVFGALVVGRRQDRPFSNEERRLLSGLAIQAAIALENVRLYAEVQNLAVLRERERIAREMHDGLAQALAYLNVKLQSVEQWIADSDPRLSQAVQDMQKVVGEAFAEVRQGIFSLKTKLNAGTSFTLTLVEYLREFESQNGLQVELVKGPGSEVPISSEAEIQLIRIIQEALANVRKHSRATTVEVRLKGSDGGLLVTVKDNGRGFVSREGGAGATRHFGLAVMKERAEIVGGRLEIESGVGGTKVAAWLPARGEGG